MRPLDRLRSIKVKLGVVIVATVAATVAACSRSARELGLAVELRVVARGGRRRSRSSRCLARGMTSPLREMAAAAARDGARRLRPPRHARRSRDEVGELARAFNAMAAELADVERMRRDLVANVSHELRTPISALQAVLENLADGVEPADPEALRTALAPDRAARPARRAAARPLAAGVAAASRSSPRASRVRELLEQAARECALGERPVRLRVERRARRPARRRATPSALHQVVANLLDNAVRHSPPRGARVGCAATTAGRRRTIEVADEGPGIPPAEAQRVFERFYRADAARSAKDGGSGLGLAIARWIVDVHGGAIRAEQRPDRAGAGSSSSCRDEPPHLPARRLVPAALGCRPARRAPGRARRRADRTGAGRHRRPRDSHAPTPGGASAGLAAAALAVMPALRSAGWVAALSLLASVVLASTGAAGARSWRGVVAGALGWLRDLAPGLAALWPRRCARPRERRLAAGRARRARGAALAALLLAIFVPLFVDGGRRVRGDRRRRAARDLRRGPHRRPGG